MEGQLAEHPLAELIREITHAGFSGALRVWREPARVVIYFDAGQTVFATSNLRAHRLREALKRSGISDAQLSNASATASDEELAKSMLTSGVLSRESLQRVRGVQAGDVLRAALLWPDGQWAFDQRIRVADDLRVEVDIDRMLLECARHLPLPIIKSRFENVNGSYSIAAESHALKLLTSEEFLLSRAMAVDGGVKLADLAMNGVSEEDILRGVYALSLSGLLQRSDWRLVFGAAIREKPKTRTAQVSSVGSPDEDLAADEADVDKFLERLKAARNYYEVLDVPRVASIEEIKSSYHTVARRFHPDRFHQSAPELRNRIESAFARSAQAYEILSDSARRFEYDQKVFSKPAARVSPKPKTVSPPAAEPKPEANRAESIYRQGLDALKHNQHDEAIRLLADAATLKPGVARYRGYYGAALMHRSNSRRAAEAELQAALELEPDNSAFRLMLAELYQSVGLRRRAQNEAARVLAADPKNETARAMLSTLKNK